MALFQMQKWDFKDDKEHFEKLYDMTYEAFIAYYSDSEVIDLTGKIVISLSADSDKNLPVDLLTIFIPEEDRCKYIATLIYSGHIAFIKLEYSDGEIKYLYKDDECCPQSMKELKEYESSVIYCCEEKGFKAKDVCLQIEKFIQSNFDYNFKLDEDNLIILEGL